MEPSTFYDKKWQDSPLETATIQDVHYTLVDMPIPGAAEGQTQQVQLPHYACKVITDQGKEFDNVGWTNLYLNPATGAGMYVVPKIQTRVLLAFPKGGNPVILAFLAPVELDGKYTNNRDPIPAGSVMMKTDFGSMIKLLEGGIITLQSTPICRRTFIPFGDQIRDFCRNYFLTTSGGDLSWTESTDGERLTALRIEAFEKGGGQGRSVQMQMGSHEDGDPDPTIPDQKLFSFVVNGQTQIYIGANGRIMIRNQQPDDNNESNDISIESNGKFTLQNVKDILVEAGTGKITIQAGTTQIVMEHNGDVTINSGTKITLNAPEIELNGDVVKTSGITQLAGGGLPVARMFDPVLVMTPTGPMPGKIIGGSSLTQSG